MTSGPAGPAVEVLTLDDEGVGLRAFDDAVLDVLFDGRRIWSFHAVRDTSPAPGEGADSATRRASWPGPMAAYLHGTARVEVAAHVAGVVLHAADHVFGDGQGEVGFVDKRGLTLSMDNSGRMQPTFDTRSEAQVAPLLDSVELVLGALRDAGVQAFPAYGTLLGAVRDHALIGHDSDADLGYVSAHTHPVDVIRESFELQRRLAAAGYEVVRYSGAGFKVVVVEPDGYTRGLDVFGGFLDHGPDETVLVLLGEVRVPFREEWVFPLATTTLEGRTLPAPAVPEHLLAAMYGPGWSTPDPAFKFETPDSTTRRLDDWFRGSIAHRAAWDRHYQTVKFAKPTPKVSPLARLVARRETAADLVVDLGCGRGRDARFLARRGLRVLGLDYSARAFHFLDQPEQREGLDLTFAGANLLELRHALSWGTRVGRHPGRRAVMARHLVDALTPRGRQHLWRFLALACHGGGRSYLDLLTAADPEDPWVRRSRLSPLDPDAVQNSIVAAGGRIVRRRDLDAVLMGTDPGDPHAEVRRGCRMVVQWS